MARNSAITWTHHTFNPWWGCWKISAGCDNCYASSFDHRLGGHHWGKEFPRRFFGDAHWREPLAWNKDAAARGVRERVFCASMADVFEKRAGTAGAELDAARERLWTLIQSTPALDWLLLTKRPEAMKNMLPWTRREPLLGAAGPWPNVWLGTTVENASYVHRANTLREEPAAVRFISYEPALGPIADAIDLAGIHWIVCGDESGAGRRPADPAWFRALRDRCEHADVAFHFKQWAGEPAAGIEGKRVSGKIHLPVLDGRVHAAFPEVRRG